MKIYIIPLPLAIIPDGDDNYHNYHVIYWTDYANTYIHEYYKNGSLCSEQDFILITIYLYDDGKTNVNKPIRIDYTPSCKDILQRGLNTYFNNQFVTIDKKRVPVVKWTGHIQDSMFLYHLNGNYNTVKE